MSDGRPADVVFEIQRCCVCGKIDREDWINRRMAEDLAAGRGRMGCRKCGSNKFLAGDFPLTKSEYAELRTLFFNDERNYRDD